MEKAKKQLTDEEWAAQQAEYNRYMHSKTWRTIRKAKIAMAGNRCEECGEDRLQLHVHHIRYTGFGGKELPGDLKVLCKPCHVFEHRLRKNPRLRRKVAKQKRKAKKEEVRQAFQAEARKRNYIWSSRQRENETPARIVWTRPADPSLPQEPDPALRPGRFGLRQKGA